jgi:hypothetical protein
MTKMRLGTGTLCAMSGEEVSHRVLKGGSADSRKLRNVETGASASSTPVKPIARQGNRGRAARALAIFGGGTNGNQQLTATAAVLLLILLPPLGITTVWIGQLIAEHLFLGLLLIGPVALKMASTGYRFTRYYTGSPTYRHRGPPELILRLVAPVMVLMTVIVFATGVVLLFAAQHGTLLLIHKLSFIVWLVFTGLHVLGHLPGLGRSLRVARTNPDDRRTSPGGAGRGLAVIGALVAGLVLAISLIPQYHVWTARAAVAHHEHRRG